MTEFSHSPVAGAKPDILFFGGIDGLTDLAVTYTIQSSKMHEVIHFEILLLCMLPSPNST